jgi:hypothetical protein
MMLGTRDWGGKGMLGEELDDLREDLRGFPLASRTGVEEVRETDGLKGREDGDGGLSETVGEGRGDERGKGTAGCWLSKEETNFDLSRKGGRWACSSSS